jgi:hypothetical protein
MTLKQICYYTCNSHDLQIELLCRKQLLKADLPIISVSLNQEIDFGDVRLVEHGEKGPKMMFRQIVTGLQAATADYVYMCENDVLYHPSHFYFVPNFIKHPGYFYYNTNVWKVRWLDGHAVWTDNLQQISGIIASRQLLLDYFSKKLVDDFDRHYEPDPRINWQSEVCNIDIRHDKTLTKSKWKPSDFRNPRYAQGWKETDEIPGWGKFNSVIKEI